MIRALVVAKDNETKAELRKNLDQYELACSFTSYKNGVREAVTNGQPDVILFEIGQQLPGPEIREIIRKAKMSNNLPVIALITGNALEIADGCLDTSEVDDFLVSPYNSEELTLRIKRLLRGAKKIETSERIKCDGLTIDLATCEVTVDGKIVELTFKEYELLKLLASNRGRVYTRDVLLDKIWGYDYYGGDRTVDVHVRRLRSKIEDASHTYIETVRNIGYRFIKNV
jgi:DNA-binding response OmpR family regulator